jgi:hypothetical protein
MRFHFTPKYSPCNYTCIRSFCFGVPLGWGLLSWWSAFGGEGFQVEHFKQWVFMGKCHNTMIILFRTWKQTLPTLKYDMWILGRSSATLSWSRGQGWIFPIVVSLFSEERKTFHLEQKFYHLIEIDCTQRKVGTRLSIHLKYQSPSSYGEHSNVLTKVKLSYRITDRTKQYPHPIFDLEVLK